ncbi:MAG: OsmC family protein [Armatimonadota bacterium]
MFKRAKNAVKQVQNGVKHSRLKETDMADVVFSVDVKCQSPTCAEAQARGFTFKVDEPEQLGGTNAGPNPVEYVIGAYAGCLNVVGHMAAKELGFDIQNLHIHVEGSLDPAGFMGQDPNVRPGYKEIRVKFNIKTDAPKETLDKWLDIVGKRCPVGDNLRNPTPITTTMEISKPM